MRAMYRKVPADMELRMPDMRAFWEDNLQPSKIAAAFIVAYKIIYLRAVYCNMFTFL